MKPTQDKQTPDPTDAGRPHEPSGPYVIGGKLFFKMDDGSTISCVCIGEPYASKIVKMWDRGRIY